MISIGLHVIAGFVIFYLPQGRAISGLKPEWVNVDIREIDPPPPSEPEPEPEPMPPPKKKVAVREPVAEPPPLVEPKSMQDSLDFAIELDLDAVTFYALVVYPGNELFALLKNQGKLRHTEFAHFTSIIDRDNTPLHYVPDGLTERDIKQFIFTAYRRFSPATCSKIWSSS